MNIETLENLFREIVPAQALQIKPAHYADGQLTLTAPLAPNRNDKGTGFAGSIASMLMLAGWGTITLRLQEAGVDADVMVVKSEIEYSCAARAELKSTAELKPADATRLLEELQKKQRSRIPIEARLFSDDRLCATLTAHYAVFLKA
jgi:thioesterase domain-containing protein